MNNERYYSDYTATAAEHLANLMEELKSGIAGYTTAEGEAFAENSDIFQDIINTMQKIAATTAPTDSITLHYTDFGGLIIHY